MVSIPRRRHYHDRAHTADAGHHPLFLLKAAPSSFLSYDVSSRSESLPMFTRATASSSVLVWPPPSYPSGIEPAATSLLCRSKPCQRYRPLAALLHRSPAPLAGWWASWATRPVREAVLAYHQSRLLAREHRVLGPDSGLAVFIAFLFWNHLFV
jgi:hypothetical protein